MNLLLAPATIAARKVVDKKVGVLVGSSEFHSSTRLVQSIGVCEPKYAYPTKKGEGKKMTKKNLLVSLFLVFGLVAMTATAMAQVQWVAGAGESLSGRPQGETEETGVVTLTTWTTGTVASGNYWLISYNAPIVPGSLYLECSGSVTPLSPFYAAEPTCGSILLATLQPDGMTVKIAFTNAGANTVFPTGSSNSIALTVRVNATEVTCVPPGPGIVTALHTPFPLSGSLYGISDTTTGVHYPVLQVNCPAGGPDLSLTYAYNEKYNYSSKGATWVIGKPAAVLSCIGVEEVHPWDDYFGINVDEEFAYALTTESYEYLSDPGSPADVTNGSNVVVTFTQVPKGVWIEYADEVPCSAMLTGDPNYCNTTTYTGTLNLGTPTVTTSSEAGTPPVYMIIYTFPVLSTDAGRAENVDLWFLLTSHGRPIPPGYTTTPITASVTLGPVTPATAIPLFDGSAEAKPLPVVDFSDCQTFLLFPYVTDEYGWDTGLAVSNTSLDPFATDPTLSYYLGRGSAKPQSGPITFYTYSGGTQYKWTTPTAVIPGSSYTTDVASIAPPGGVSGYVIAVCNFENAHGYAIVLTNFGLSDAVAANYIATVLPDPEWYHRFPAGDYLGESAIAPYLFPDPPPTNPKY